MSATSILVVEDEFLIALMITHILEDAGYRVLGPAGSAREAITLVSETLVDGAVLDCNLGGERCDRIARFLHELGVPFLFVTGYSRVSLPPEFLGAPVVSKPVDRTRLLEGVNRLMGKSAPRDDGHGR